VTQFHIGSAATKRIAIEGTMANRHGLITGATGTGKTVTMQALIERFAKQGVPVFATDVKGDLSGITQTGSASAAWIVRAYKDAGLDYVPVTLPSKTWTVGQASGGNRITLRVDELGAPLLGRMLNLSPVQQGVLNVVFEAARRKGSPLHTATQLQVFMTEMIRNPDRYAEVGYVSASSLQIIQRQMLELGTSGEHLFSDQEPFDVSELDRTEQGLGMVNLLDASNLINSPATYSVFLAWLMQHLLDVLPERGDSDKPRMVFMFDEAHLIFKDAPKAMVAKAEQVIRLVRSKGVGIYFVTQAASDIPDTILDQLGNRIAHAQRGYTGRSLQAVKATANSFRPNPSIKTEEVLPNLGKGQALVSVLDSRGTPTPVEIVQILPPQTFVGAVKRQEDPTPQPDVISPDEAILKAATQRITYVYEQRLNHNVVMTCAVLIGIAIGFVFGKVF